MELLKPVMALIHFVVLLSRSRAQMRLCVSSVISCLFIFGTWLQFFFCCRVCSLCFFLFNLLWISIQKITANNMWSRNISRSVSTIKTKKYSCARRKRWQKTQLIVFEKVKCYKSELKMRTEESKDIKDLLMAMSNNTYNSSTCDCGEIVSWRCSTHTKLHFYFDAISLFWDAKAKYLSFCKSGCLEKTSVLYKRLRDISEI